MGSTNCSRFPRREIIKELQEAKTEYGTPLFKPEEIEEIVNRLSYYYKEGDLYKPPRKNNIDKLRDDPFFKRYGISSYGLDR